MEASKTVVCYVRNRRFETSPSRKQGTFATVRKHRLWPRPPWKKLLLATGRAAILHGTRPLRGESHSRPSRRATNPTESEISSGAQITNPVSSVPLLVSHRFVKLWPLPMRAKLRWR
jgi:hypothetical protein